MHVVLPRRKALQLLGCEYLNKLRYNSQPEKLQAVVQQIFRLATHSIEIPCSVVIAVPLCEALDRKNTDDYCQRVEPSAQGGEKMGKFLVDAVVQGLDQHDNNNSGERSRQ